MEIAYFPLRHAGRSSFWFGGHSCEFVLMLLYFSVGMVLSSTHTLRAALQTRQAKPKHQLSPVYVKSAGC